MGCLTAPFRLLGCLGVLVALVVGWLYRDRLLREGRGVLGRIESAKPLAGSTTNARGRPGTRALASAEAKIDSLNGWGADSVVLTASEVASLMGQGLSPDFRKELDSLQVELLEGEVRVRARLRTARLPKEILGPLARALEPNEPVEATGPLRVIAPGSGDWVVRSFEIRDFPVPASAVKRLVAGALRDPTRETVPWKVPPGVREVRVRPTGATLYGARRS
jgi:hypothetical protein